MNYYFIYFKYAFIFRNVRLSGEVSEIFEIESPSSITNVKAQIEKQNEKFFIKHSEDNHFLCVENIITMNKLL